MIPWASTTRAGPPRPGTEFAVCWCSELARVGVDLARDGQMDRVVVFPGAGPSRKVSKASLSRKSGPNSEVGSTRVGSVRCQVSLVLGTPVLRELRAIFRNFYGLMRYGILQHDPQVRLVEIFPLASINAFEWERSGTRSAPKCPLLALKWVGGKSVLNPQVDVVLKIRPPHAPKVPDTGSTGL